MKQLILALIRRYQVWWSPDHSWRRQFYPTGCCRFYPSCSEYTYQAVEKFGAIKGLGMGLKRIAKCHPWREYSLDPVSK